MSSPTKKANAPGLPDLSHILSHVTVAGGLIYVSGQLPTDSTDSGGIQARTRQCIENVEKALKAVGADLTHLVKVNIYVTDMADFNAINEVYSKTIPSPKPSRTCIQAAKLPADSDIEIEAVAAVPSKF